MVFHYPKVTANGEKQKFPIQIGFYNRGALGGFLYWKFVGCVNGTCPIKSVWYLSTLWGMALGYLVSDIALNFTMKRGTENDKKI